MRREHRTEVITTAENLKHSWWEVFRTKLDEFHITVWCIWRRLDDHCVSGIQTRTDLAERKKDGIIPGHNCTAYAQRCVAVDDLFLLVLLQDLFWQFHCTESLDPRHSHTNFLGGLRERLALLKSQEMSEVLFVGRNGISEREESLPSLLKRRL